MIPTYTEGLCNSSGNRTEREEDAFWNRVKATEDCQKNGTHNPRAISAYWYQCSVCKEKFQL